MRKRTNFEPLPWLRRRVRGVLGAVLPLLVVGWLGAAGPCVGMAAEAHEGLQQAHAEDAPHAHASGSDASPSPAHGSCPHCPGSTGAASGAHALCAALDDVTDAKRKPFSPSAEPLKLALPVPAAAAGLAPPRARTHRPRARRAPLRPAAVPLNVRHCVFIV